MLYVRFFLVNKYHFRVNIALRSDRPAADLNVRAYSP